MAGGLGGIDPVDPDGSLVGQLSRAELVALVGVLMTAGAASEADGDALLGLLEGAVPDPDVCDLIFYSSPSLSAEAVVDRALAYKAIEL